MATSCFDPNSFIYSSPRGPIHIPPDPDMFHNHIRSVARGLSSLGVRQHDVVLILSPNSVYFPVLFFAVISLGAVVTTVNPLCTPGEILKQIKDSKSKLVFTVPELAGKVENTALPVIYIDDCEPKSNPDFNQERHLKLLSEVIKMNFDPDFHQETDLTFLCIIPMFHVFGLSIVVYGQLLRGNTLITMPKFDFTLMLESIQKYRITNLPLVPPIMIALAKQDAVLRYDLSSVIEMVSGAAPVGKETLEEVYQRLKVPDLRQGYGMTETTGIVSVAILKTDKKNYATVGPLVSGMEAVVVDPSSGRRLPPNKQGELWVRGPNIMQSYLNNPEATALTLDGDGWLHTGDLGYIDDEGNLYIMDRLKELIKYKGLQVAPAELEALLLTHSEIVDAAVVPLPDNDAGEVPLAYVVRASGSSLSEQDVIRFVAAQVAPYKKVRGVKFIEAIPKSSAGKILRRELTQKLPSKL
ncbi:hypothetical protein GOP47_0005052 [Adiantum capillus-veneris]|uniref:4-coumarate--CoA ligase n=1 Tax=Adiantum capillus-veneris TaxID=13818 RepID=A0A9D4V4N1_ADICA|nr:hypothetical protein GOP47_0005052 [Adiantum capillus-veneris]